MSRTPYRDFKTYADVCRIEKENWQLRAENAALKEQFDKFQTEYLEWRIERIAMCQDVRLLVDAVQFYMERCRGLEGQRHLG